MLHITYLICGICISQSVRPPTAGVPSQVFSVVSKNEQLRGPRWPGSGSPCCQCQSTQKYTRTILNYDSWWIYKCCVKPFYFWVHMHSSPKTRKYQLSAWRLCAAGEPGPAAASRWAEWDAATLGKSQEFKAKPVANLGEWQIAFEEKHVDASTVTNPKFK